MAEGSENWKTQRKIGEIEKKKLRSKAKKQPFEALQERSTCLFVLTGGIRIRGRGVGARALERLNALTPRPLERRPPFRTI